MSNCAPEIFVTEHLVLLVILLSVPFFTKITANTANRYNFNIAAKPDELIMPFVGEI